MAKSITLNRHELVWQTRSNTWKQEDFDHLLEWLKGFKEKENESENCDAYIKNHASEYSVLSQFTWDQIVNMFDKGEDEDEIRVQYYAHDGEPMYTQGIVEVISDYMREDNYDSDVIDENYADDYEENFEVDNED